MSRGRRGQAMVEFALVAPLLVLLIFGTIDIGRAVFAFSTISQAASVGARLVVPGLGLDFPPPNTADVIAAVRGRAGGLALAGAPAPNCNGLAPGSWGTPDSNTGWIYVNPTAAGTGACTDVSTIGGHQPVRVTVRYRFAPVTPGVVGILGGGIVLTAFATYSTEY